MRTLLALSVACLSTAAVPAAAQQAGELTLFGSVGHSGARFTVTGPRTNLNVPFRVRSILMNSGAAWELCTSTNYRGCTTFRSSVRSMNMVVRSARPIGGATTLPAPAGHGPSLKGMSAEFFARPELNGGRVAAAGTADAAASSANRFCQQAGWTRSAYQRLETVQGRNYLADVLCVRSM